MNLAQIVESVYQRSGLTVDDPVATKTKVIGYVNEALRAISTARPWPWLQVTAFLTTTAGQDTYDAPSPWTKTLALVDPDEGQLDRVSRDEADVKWNATSRGHPEAWTYFADKLLIRPVPDGRYQLIHRYTIPEPDIGSDLDVPRMPAQFHDAIVEKAAAITLRSTRESGRAAEADAAYKEWEKGMADDQRRSRSVSKIQSRTPAWWL